jgi:hypothetical protein
MGSRGRYGGGTPVEGGPEDRVAGCRQGGDFPPSYLNFSFGTASVVNIYGVLCAKAKWRQCGKPLGRKLAAAGPQKRPAYFLTVVKPLPIISAIGAPRSSLTLIR